MTSRPPSPDDIWDAITQAAHAFIEDERQRREAFLASPAQVAKREATRERRSAAGKRAWVKRRAAMQEQKELQLREEELDEEESAARRSGEGCEAVDFPGPPHPWEVPCSLYAGHTGEPHENTRYGLTWDWDNEDQ